MDSILFISASSSSSSVNCHVMQQVLEISSHPFLDLSKYAYSIPMLVNSHLESSSAIPKHIVNIYREISKYDRLVIFSPEHNSYFSSFFKNILDWLSLYKRDFLFGKDLVVVSVSETSRPLRYMEQSIAITLSQFSPKSFKFINFNKYTRNIKKIRFIQLLKEII